MNTTNIYITVTNEEAHLTIDGDFELLNLLLILFFHNRNMTNDAIVGTDVESKQPQDFTQE